MGFLCEFDLFLIMDITGYGEFAEKLLLQAERILYQLEK